MTKRKAAKKQTPSVKHEPRRSGGYRGKVAVDFDGVLHDYTLGWTGYEPIGDPIEGAIDFIKAVFEKGYEPVVFSARADTGYGARCIERWLAQHGFPALRVFPKMNAIAYIDDRGVHCDPAMGGPVDGFDFALSEIQRLADVRREHPPLTAEQREKIYGRPLGKSLRTPRALAELTDTYATDAELGIVGWEEGSDGTSWPIFSDEDEDDLVFADDGALGAPKLGCYPWDRK